MKRNLILISRDLLSRICIFCIRKCHDSEMYEMCEKSGKLEDALANASTLRCDIWFRNGSLDRVHQYQLKMYESRLKKGFIDVESADYAGSTYNRTSLAHCLESETYVPMEEVKEMEEEGKDYTVICINNTGIEDRFDVGIEYVWERVPSLDTIESQLICLWDKNGVKGEFFRDRFNCLSPVS